MKRRVTVGWGEKAGSGVNQNTLPRRKIIKNEIKKLILRIIYLEKWQ